MDRRYPEASSGKICHLMVYDGRPVIFKFAVFQDSIFMSSGKAAVITGIDGCLSCMGALYMT